MLSTTAFKAGVETPWGWHGGLGAEDKGWTSTSIGHRLKVLYESNLLEFERIHFKGKRYARRGPGAK